MVDQRRSQRVGHGARRCGGVRLLALALTLSFAFGCDGQRSLLDVDDRPGIGGGGTGGGGNPLVGEWEVTLVIFVSTDVQAWTTNWTFATDGTCEFQQEVRSVLDDTTTIENRTCTWSTTNDVLRIEFDDNGTVNEGPFSFPGGDTTRLVFQDVEYHRIGA